MTESKTELQRLLTNRLEELIIKHKTNRTERERLDAEAKQLESDIQALNEALQVEARATGHTIVKSASNGSRLLGLRLVDAIRLLRQEDPKITKRGARHKLREVGFDFKGKRPGSAVHMAWTITERWKHKGGDIL
ncbi:MAG: hypothetical protein HYY45_00005, partial [Deltaproteobacteria bacterium]|nr:hypothetical protein [Deltaproteobacteria bacterium]